MYGADDADTEGADAADARASLSARTSERAQKRKRERCMLPCEKLDKDRYTEGDLGGEKVPSLWSHTFILLQKRETWSTAIRTGERIFFGRHES